MEEKWCVILNPIAARGAAARRWPKIQRALTEAGVRYEYLRHEGITEMAQNVEKAKSRGFHKFLVIGGDGTLHHALNAIMPWTTATVPVLAVIPVGTGNDWARTFGMTTDLTQLSRGMLSSDRRSVDIGKIIFTRSQRVHYFINVAGMCMDASVVKRVAGKTRSRMGALAYLVEGVRTLMSYRPPKVTLKSGDAARSGHWMTIHAGVGKYCGGGMCFVPHGGHSDGKLAITGIRGTSRFKLILNIYRLYFGTILGFSDVFALKSSEVSLTEDIQNTLEVEADGEYLGSGSVIIEIVPSAVSIICP